MNHLEGANYGPPALRHAVSSRQWFWYRDTSQVARYGLQRDRRQKEAAALANPGGMLFRTSRSSPQCYPSLENVSCRNLDGFETVLSPVRACASVDLRSSMREERIHKPSEAVATIPGRVSNKASKTPRLKVEAWWPDAGNHEQTLMCHVHGK